MTDSKWKNYPWFVVTDPNCYEYDFMPAWKKAGASGVISEMNIDHDTPNKNWPLVPVQPYEYDMPVFGIYNLEISAYHRYIPDYGYYPLRDHVTLEDDPVWQKIAAACRHKFMQGVILRFGGFYNDNDAPIPQPHVIAIVESAIDRVTKHIQSVNHRIKVVLPMIDERIIGGTHPQYTDIHYPDLGGVMSAQPYCMADMDTRKSVVNLDDWNDLSLYYPSDQIMGYDGELHSGPPYSYAQNWYGWLWAYYKFVNGDCKRKEGKGVMGAAFFNMTKSALYQELGVEPIIEVQPPDDEPTEPPDDNDDDDTPGTFYDIVNELKTINENIGTINQCSANINSSLAKVINILEE